MERTGITIKHFYSATYVQANRWTPWRQNRTKDEENKDLKISLVRRCWLRKSLIQEDGEGRKAHRGWDAGEYRKWEGLCFDAVLGLCSVNCDGRLSTSMKWTNPFALIFISCLFCHYTETTVFTLNFLVNSLLFPGLCFSFVNLQCSKVQLPLPC